MILPSDLGKETTSFQFSASANAWLQSMAVAQSGWSNANLSYEAHYQIEVPVGTESTLKQGWGFPGLFHTGDTWGALSKSAMDRS